MSNYQIVGIKTNSSLDVYASERIERIFYQSSYIYILFFLCLYLILFPICIFTECTRKHN